MVLTKKHWILIGVVIAILAGGILIYSGWTKQKSEPAESQPEQTKSKPMKQIMIPSSLDPDDVIAHFVPYMPPAGEKLTKNDPFWEERFGITGPNKEFITGFSVAWYGSAYYLTKEGDKLGGDPHSYVLELSVLKYRSHDSAQEDYTKIGIEQNFKEIIFKEVELKSKDGSFAELGPETESKTSNLQQYLLRSNNFIVYMFGLRKATEDAMTRLIDLYAAETR